MVDECGVLSFGVEVFEEFGVFYVFVFEDFDGDGMFDDVICCFLYFVYVIDCDM